MQSDGKWALSPGPPGEFPVSMMIEARTRHDAIENVTVGLDLRTLKLLLDSTAYLINGPTKYQRRRQFGPARADRLGVWGRA